MVKVFASIIRPLGGLFVGTTSLGMAWTHSGGTQGTEEEFATNHAKRQKLLRRHETMRNRLGVELGRCDCAGNVRK